jgi:hypothetical protein
MTTVRLGLRDSFVNRDLSAPRFLPSFFRRHKLAKVDWLILSPNAARTSKIRYAGFRAHARAGEDDDATARIKQRSQVFNKLVRLIR